LCSLDRANAALRRRIVIHAVGMARMPWPGSVVVGAGRHCRCRDDSGAGLVRCRVHIPASVIRRGAGVDDLASSWFMPVPPVMSSSVRNARCLIRRIVFGA